MLPKTNKISSIKTKRNPKLNKQKTGDTLHNTLPCSWNSLP